MITKKQIQINSKVKGFVEYKPDGWNGSTPLPLVIFCHGLGQCGTNLDSVLSIAMPQVLNSGQIAPQAVILMPQFSEAWPAWFRVDDVITYGLANYNIDPDRVSLTGPSMGGAAVLDWGEAGPTSVARVAALAPVCPASVPQSFGQNFVDKNIATFFTCGDKDDLFNGVQQWVDFLNTRNINPTAKFRILPGVGHNSWDAAYNPNSTAYEGKNIYDWLIAQSRGPKVTKRKATAILYDDGSRQDIS
jgi:predicted peptidase